MSTIQDNKAQKSYNQDSSIGSPNTDLMSRRQVANLFGVCTGTIKRWQHNGELKAVVLNPRLTRYERSEIERLLKEGRIGG